MALPMIETGYKPEFGLGAVYQGFNAANADMSAQEELIKQFLANQREQQMQPLDINVRGMESDRATQARSPEMLQAYKDLYLSQRDQTKASGDKARELSALDIATGRQDLQHKQAVGNLVAQLDAMKARGDTGGGQIGFLTQPTQSVPVEGKDFFGNFAKGNPQANLKAIGTIKDPVDRQNALAAFKAYQEQAPSQPQAVNANNSPLVPSPPLRNGGIAQGSPEYEAVMQALVDQPELRTKLLLGDQKYDSTEFNKMLDLVKARESAALRASEHGAKPAKTFEEFIARILEKKAAGQELSPAEIEAWDNASGGFNAKNAAKIQPGTKLNLEKLPNVPLEEKPVQQQYAPSTSAPQSKSKLSPEERAAIIKKLTESK